MTCQQLCLGLAEVCSFGLPSSMQEGIIVPSVVAPTWCYRVWLVRGCGVLPRCRQPAGNAGPVHTSAPQTYFRHSALYPGDLHEWICMSKGVKLHAQPSDLPWVWMPPQKRLRRHCMMQVSNGGACAHPSGVAFCVQDRLTPCRQQLSPFQP